MKIKGTIQFEQGTKPCGRCGKITDDIVQHETKRIVKGLPITEIRFGCKKCLEELIEGITIIEKLNGFKLSVTNPSNEQKKED